MICRAQRFALRIALVIQLLLPSVVVAQIADLQDMFETATKSSRAWSEENAVVVDPKLTYDIAAGIRNFSEIFLRDDSMREPARELLADTAAMNAVIATFLNQSYSGTSITHVFDLLAGRLNVQSSAAGYTDTYFNRYVMLQLPDGWEDSIFLLDDLSGSVPSGRRVLLGFGSHALIHDGGTYMLHVVPHARDRVTVSLEGFNDSERDVLAPLWVQPDLEWFCDDIGPEFDFGPDRMQILASERAPFYQADRVRIQILDETRVCSGSCERAMSGMIARAIAQWRSGCANCGPVSLRLIEVGEELWVDDAMLEALEFQVLHDGGKGVLTSAGSNFLSRLSFRPRSQMFANGFRRIDGTPYAEALCTEAAQRFGGTYFHNRLCGAHAGTCNTPECMEFTVGMSRSDAQCTLPDRVDRVACGRPDSHIAFNSDHVVFTIGTDQSFGTSTNPMHTVDAERIIYHEVGHWFRLPHLHGDLLSSDGRIDIMADKPPVIGSVCIRASTLAQLDRAIVDEWQDQLLSEEAFEAPEEWR